ncbi:heat shock protein 30C-like [Pogoniulus pusillus]|uniref:heat shock protein 30C-like n=1 Tax=Pogoniulus pusillus TaxID=488313 RepID=UPI0030B99DC3
MLCRMHFMPPMSSSLFPWLGPVRTLWPHPGTIFAELERELRLEMERAREFMSSFEQFLSSSSSSSSASRIGITAERAPPASAALTQGSGEGFSVCQDVKDFAPEQLSVKVVGRKVVLVGQKETQSTDEKGSFSYKYEVLKREWDVPEEVDAEALTCSLTKEGQLRIEAPRLALPAAPERNVPIQMGPAVAQSTASTDDGAERAKA